jgi:glycosyltransferase involved in cell wall biosynthesis
MHIAFLTPEYPGPKTGHSGGLGTSIKNLATALVQVGINVSVFVYGQSQDEVINENGIRLYRIKNKQFKGLSWWLTRKKIEHLINGAIRNQKINILEVADWTGISAWMKIDCPVVMRLNGSDTYFCSIENRQVKWWNKLHEKKAYQQANAILAVSDFVGHKTNDIFELNRNYAVIPNSIDANRFQSYKEENTYPTILYFGTLIRKKGVLDIPLIFNKVMDAIPNAQLILVGSDANDIESGNYSTWDLMKPLFSEIAFKQVCYLGKQPYSEIQEYIKQANVCIFPSYAEALPVSWLEAMAMEKAIVASDIGWATEMLTHEKEALLCHPSQHEVFAEHIVRLLTDEVLKKALGNNARKRVETQFDNAVVAKQNIEFYKKVIAQKD